MKESTIVCSVDRVWTGLRLEGQGERLSGRGERLSAQALARLMESRGVLVPGTATIGEFSKKISSGDAIGSGSDRQRQHPQEPSPTSLPPGDSTRPDSGAIPTWGFESSQEDEDSVILRGPWFAGEDLDSLILRATGETVAQSAAVLPTAARGAGSQPRADSSLNMATERGSGTPGGPERTGTPRDSDPIPEAAPESAAQSGAAPASRDSPLRKRAEAALTACAAALARLDAGSAVPKVRSNNEMVSGAVSPASAAGASVPSDVPRSAPALPEGLISCGILQGEAGVLVLPPRAVRQAFARLPADRRACGAAWLRSPKATTPRSEAVFLLAQASYRLATGRPAFVPEEDPAEGLRGDLAFARGGFVPSRMAQPALDPALATLIDASLADPASRSLSDWATATAALSGSGWLGEVDPAALAEASRQRQAREGRIQAEGKRTRFWRRRGTIISGSLAVVAVLALVVISVVTGKSQGPDFSALSPEGLVAAYYKAIDSLDSEALAAAADSKAAKADDGAVVNLTVITKMRQAYERTSPLVSAKAWIEAGKPELETGSIVFGITDLQITRPEAGTDAGAATGQSSVIVDANYIFWASRPGEVTDDGTRIPKPVVAGRKLRDRLTVGPAPKPRKGWRILKIERSEEGEIR